MPLIRYKGINIWCSTYVTLSICTKYDLYVNDSFHWWNFHKSSQKPTASSFIHYHLHCLCLLLLWYDKLNKLPQLDLYLYGYVVDLDFCRREWECSCMIMGKPSIWWQQLIKFVINDGSNDHILWSYNKGQYSAWRKWYCTLELVDLRLMKAKKVNLTVI